MWAFPVRKAATETTRGPTRRWRLGDRQRHLNCNVLPLKQIPSRNGDFLASWFKGIHCKPFGHSGQSPPKSKSTPAFHRRTKFERCIWPASSIRTVAISVVMEVENGVCSWRQNLDLLASSAAPTSRTASTYCVHQAADTGKQKFEIPFYHSDPDSTTGWLHAYTLLLNERWCKKV